MNKFMDIINMLFFLSTRESLGVLFCLSLSNVIELNIPSITNWTFLCFTCTFARETRNKGYSKPCFWVSYKPILNINGFMLSNVPTYGGLALIKSNMCLDEVICCCCTFNTTLECLYHM